MTTPQRIYSTKHGCRLGHIPQQGINDKVHLELLISMLLSLSMWKHTQKHTYTHTHTYTYTHLLSIYIFIHMKLWSLSRVYKVDTESQTIRASNVHTWFRSNLDFAWPWAPTCDPVDVPYTGKHCMTNIRHTNITPHTSIHCMANISVWL